MGSELPAYSSAEFEHLVESCYQRVRGQAPAAAPLDDLAPEGRLASQLFCHYQELRRWNPRLSLIGPGTAHDALWRHYGESLAALSLLVGERPGSILDIGSGAGFPGLVLSAALPRHSVVLTEARQRKWAFLQTAARRCALSCECLNARVTGPMQRQSSLSREAPLVVVSRAVKLPKILLDRFEQAVSEIRFLLWVGPEFEVPTGWLCHQELRIRDTEGRNPGERERPSRGTEGRAPDGGADGADGATGKSERRIVDLRPDRLASSR